MNVQCESGCQLLVRLQGRPDIKKFCSNIFDGNLEYKDVVEITGHSGSGKTELLIHMILNCILPQELGGLNSSVVYIDTDRNFDLLRLVAVLEGKLEDYLNRKMISENQDKTQLITTYLEKLLIIQPSDYSQLILSIHYLNDFLLNWSDVILIIIDSITNFYWLDKMIAGDNVLQLRSRQHMLVDLLKKIVQQFGVVLMVTRQVLFNLKNTEKDDQILPDLLGWNWQKFVTTHLAILQNVFDSFSNSKKINVQVQKKMLRLDTYFQISDFGLAQC